MRTGLAGNGHRTRDAREARRPAGPSRPPMMAHHPYRHHPVPRALIGLALLLAVPLGALAGPGDNEPAQPQIRQFDIRPTTEDGVRWHVFHWQVANTDQVKLFQNDSEIPGRTQRPDGSVGWPPSMSGSLRMRLKASATFALVAVDRAGNTVSQTQRAEVEARQAPTAPTEAPSPVEDMPHIRSFRAHPTTAEPGGTVAFSWEVEHAQAIRLFEGDHEVDLRGLEGTLSTGGNAVFSTTIDETTTFRLTASDHQRRATTRSLTVQVERSGEPVATCMVRGQLTGTWQQQVREHPTGPASTWTVEVYAYAHGTDRPAAQASVSSDGTYRIHNLAAGKRYRLRPNWDADPRQADVSCDAGQAQQGPDFRITGRPLID